MAKTSTGDFQARLRKIEGLIHALDEIANPSARASAHALVQGLLELHSLGLERMLEHIYESSSAGQALIDELGHDDLVGNLLLLHGLHPLDLETRVRQALSKVRPYMRSHGGNVDLITITGDGVVKLRLEGSCHSCPSSRVTLKYAVEEAIYAVAPDVTAIEAEGVIEPESHQLAGFIPVTALFDGVIPAAAPEFGQPVSSGNRHASPGGWISVEGLSTLPDGSLRTLAVTGKPVLFCRVGATFYAYQNTCPNCGQLLGQARLAGKDLVCAACGHRYDILRAGRDLDEPQLHLAPFPLIEEDGQVKIAPPVAVEAFG